MEINQKKSVSLEYSLISDGMLNNWIKSYKENGYTIVEKKRGRSPTMKKEVKPIDPNDKDAIIKAKDEEILRLKAGNEYLKKIESCSSSKKGPTTKDKVMVVYELQHKYPLVVLLDISGLKRSTYYYTLNKLDKDTKNDDIMNAIIEIYYTHKARYGYRRITLELINR